MSNVVRNSLILLVVFILIIVFRFAFERKLVDLSESLGAELETLTQKVNKSEEMRKQIDNAQTELKILRERQLGQTKIFRKFDTPTITLEYILTLKKLISGDIIFDFLYQDKQAASNYNTYLISGEADFNQLKEFVYHIEQQKPIYTIPNISFSAIHSAPTDSVRFSLTLNSYFDRSGSENELIEIEPKYFPYSRFPMFKLGIFVKTQADEKSLPNSERLNILAMTREFIVIRHTDGKLQQLQPGDRVQFGRFKAIQFEEKQAVFIINKIGIWQVITVPFQGGIE